MRNLALTNYQIIRILKKRTEFHKKQVKTQVHLKIRIFNNSNQEASVTSKRLDRRINWKQKMKYLHQKNSGNSKNQYIANQVLKNMLNLKKE